MYVTLYYPNDLQSDIKKANILKSWLLSHYLFSLTSWAVWIWTQKLQQQAIRASLVVSPEIQVTLYPRYSRP